MDKKLFVAALVAAMTVGTVNVSAQTYTVAPGESRQASVSGASVVEVECPVGHDCSVDFNVPEHAAPAPAPPAIFITPPAPAPAPPVTVTPAPAVDNTAECKRLFVEGQALYNTMDYKLSIEKFEEAYHLCPERVDLLFNVAMSWLKIAEDSKCANLDILEIALRMFENYRQAAIKAGKDPGRDSQFARATSELRALVKACRASPQSPKLGNISELVIRETASHHPADIIVGVGGAVHVGGSGAFVLGALHLDIGTKDVLVGLTGLAGGSPTSWDHGNAVGVGGGAALLGRFGEHVALGVGATLLADVELAFGTNSLDLTIGPELRVGGKYASVSLNCGAGPGWEVNDRLARTGLQVKFAWGCGAGVAFHLPSF